MTKTILFGLDKEVEFDETEIFAYEASNGEIYPEAAVTTDNRLIAFDDTIGAWVQLASFANMH